LGYLQLRQQRKIHAGRSLLPMSWMIFGGWVLVIENPMLNYRAIDSRCACDQSAKLEQLAHAKFQIR
jgi:hypothetical protein